jgi:hypothetical protein
MKKPSANLPMKSMKNMRKKTMKIMKKPKNMRKTTMKIMKKPAGSADRVHRLRQRRQKEQKQRSASNVRARARVAAKKGASYAPRDAKYKKVAAQAALAQRMAKNAVDVADGAKTIAADAWDHAATAAMEAAEAKTEAQDAQKDAAAALSMTEQTQLRVGNLEKRLQQGKDVLKETRELAKKNAERLDADDRRRGYATPRRTQRGVRESKTQQKQ